MKFTFGPDSRPVAGYTIKRGIQRGGFGEVYQAVSDGGKEVALKLIQQHFDIELRGINHCLNLKHPNLITLFDVRTDNDGDNWVVMEFISGTSLDDVLRSFPRGLPLGEVRDWLQGIAAGVQFLHDRGLVHRDLKPSNIFREDGVVKIGDVGLSKLVTTDRRDPHTSSVGTVYYMAPEVAHGRYGTEIDVYSVGVMLYEMLTGKVPFEGESTGEILLKHLTQPADLQPIPETLRLVLARALEKDPQLRTPSVRQLCDEFIGALDGEAIPVQQPPPLRESCSKPAVDQAPFVVTDFLDEPQRPTSTERVNSSRFSAPVLIRERVARVCGQVAGASVISVLITVGMFAGLWVYTHQEDAWLTDPARCLTFAMSVALAVSSILVVNAVRDFGPSWHRPWWPMFIAGAAIGGGSYVIAQSAQMNFPREAWLVKPMVTYIGRFELVEKKRLIHPTEDPRTVSLEQTAFQPTLTGFLVNIAGALGLINWRRQQALHRERRLLWRSVFAAATVGFICSAIFSFPQLWAVLWCAAISITLQLVSPWRPQPAGRVRGEEV